MTLDNPLYDAGTEGTETGTGSETTEISAGQLEVGTNGEGEIVVNHRDLTIDESGAGHIVFSPRQARHLATILLTKALAAERELYLKAREEKRRRRRNGGMQSNEHV